MENENCKSKTLTAPLDNDKNYFTLNFISKNLLIPETEYNDEI